MLGPFLAVEAAQTLCDEADRRHVLQIVPVEHPKYGPLSWNERQPRRTLRMAPPG